MIRKKAENKAVAAKFEKLTPADIVSFKEKPSPNRYVVDNSPCSPTALFGYFTADIQKQQKIFVR